MANATRRRAYRTAAANTSHPLHIPHPHPSQPSIVTCTLLLEGYRHGQGNTASRALILPAAFPLDEAISTALGELEVGP